MFDNAIDQGLVISAKIRLFGLQSTKVATFLDLIPVFA
jgi:hypothetical protein